MRLTDGDINTWMKVSVTVCICKKIIHRMTDLLIFFCSSQKVEMASEFAVSEVFSSQKPRTGKPSRAVALQSTDQLQDHDDAYSEGTHAFISHCFRFSHCNYRKDFS